MSSGNRDGKPNERQQAAETTVYAALDLMGELNNGSIDKEVKTIRRLVPELFLYLNTTKNNVTQGMLNLFMHYHNHRRYVAGKRKGKTPIEILTGKTQDKDWLELVVQQPYLLQSQTLFLFNVMKTDVTNK
ncbi:hypothetical protein ES703_42683 [subsurface metagenome]